jgi:hypothetical protein
MGMADHMARKLQGSVESLQDGLQPESLSAWYGIIISQTKKTAPPWLYDRISVRQDPTLPMKFKLDISRRAVKYFMMAVDSNIDLMPQSTRLYFLRVQESLDTEVDRSLV